MKKLYFLLTLAFLVPSGLLAQTNILELNKQGIFSRKICREVEEYRYFTQSSEHQCGNPDNYSWTLEPSNSGTIVSSSIFDVAVEWNYDVIGSGTATIRYYFTGCNYVKSGHLSVTIGEIAPSPTVEGAEIIGPSQIQQSGQYSYELQYTKMENVTHISWSLDGEWVSGGLTTSQNFEFNHSHQGLHTIQLQLSNSSANPENQCPTQSNLVFRKDITVEVAYSYCNEEFFSDEEIILPPAPYNSAIIKDGCQVAFTSRRGITIGQGVVIEAGADVTFEVFNGPFTEPDDDRNKNWVKQTVYDGDGNIIGLSKEFSDGMGRPMQSQSKNFTTGHILASQPLYDALGNAVGGTLPAPIFNTEFNFKENFLTNSSGTAYSANDFDVDRDNPAPVGNDFGSIGWYYSHKNDIEPLTATTAFPYSRSWTERSPDPKTAISAGPGEAHRMGSGNESITTRIKISNDPIIKKYYQWRETFVTKPSGVTYNKIGDGYKIVSTNPDGKESISYIDAAGNTVVSGIMNGNEFEYGFAFFDDAGNLVAEIAPEGVAANDPSKFLSTYKYNYQGWVLEATSVDEGTSEYVYSYDGKIRFSQNSQQKADGKFSYTNYDKMGRLIESGVYNMSVTGAYIFENHYDAGTSPNSVHRIVDLNGPAGAMDGAACSDVTKIGYDLPDPECPDTQHFLVGNVSSTRNDNVTTWYSYDYQGRLEWMIQDIQGLGQKKIAYTYDFIGKVLQVAYQAGQQDAFYHHYEYDPDQRLSKVFTSKDGVNKKIQASYEYYLHGPLKRVELADNLQGIDYVYTVEGWLKGINHGDIDLDPGADGQEGDKEHFAKDAFGMTFNYYDKDYTGAMYSTGAYSVGSPSSYTGNIKAVGWHNGNEGHDQAMYKYAYDEKYQLTEAKWGKAVQAGNTYNFLESLNKYVEKIPDGYDSHGNIKSLERTDEDGDKIADFTYHYTPGTNQLARIDHQGSTLIEYGYNLIGQMVAQVENGQGMYVEYDAYGLVKGVYANEEHTQPVVQFAYDDKGQRLLKKSFDENGSDLQDTWYVRDASGTILSVYTTDYQSGTDVVQTEVPVYGAGRIGMFLAESGNYLYELTDHLGNVRSLLVYENVEIPPFVADMEAGQNPDFVNYALNRQLDVNNARSGQHAVRLNGVQGRIAGPGITLRINPGDTIQGEVYGKYLESLNGRTDLISGLAASVAGAFGYDGSPETQPVFDLFNQVLGGGALFSIKDENVPKAYLMALYFDNNFDYRDFSYEELGESGLNAWEKLSFEKIATQPGYVYIYVVNESKTNINVFFDDLKVTLKKSDIVSGNDFYPFGLPIAGRSYEREDYRFDYQGQFSEKDDETGWNAFQLRMYDARIGRWLSADPYGQFYSAYVGMGNNPEFNIDVDGGLSLPSCPGQVSFIQRLFSFIQRYDDIIISAFSGALRSYAQNTAKVKFRTDFLGFATDLGNQKTVQVGKIPYDESRGHHFFESNTHRTDRKSDSRTITLDVNGKRIKADYMFNNSPNSMDNVIYEVSDQGSIAGVATGEGGNYTFFLGPRRRIVGWLKFNSKNDYNYLWGEIKAYENKLLLIEMEKHIESIHDVKEKEYYKKKYQGWKDYFKNNNKKVNDKLEIKIVD